MSHNHHIIRTQRVEIDFPSETDAVGVPKRIGDLFNERILPEMERLFDQHASGKGQLSFDRMEIDCGALESESWEDQLVERTLLQVKEQLLLGASAPEASPAAKARRLADAWCHFLARGYLAWDSPVSDIATFEKALVVDHMLLARLAHTIRQSPVALDRFLRSFSDSFKAGILAVIQASSDNPFLASLLAGLPRAWQREEWLQRAALIALTGIGDGNQRAVSGKPATLAGCADQLLRHAPATRQTQACQAIGAVYAGTETSLGTAFLEKYVRTQAMEALAQAISHHSAQAAGRWAQEITALKAREKALAEGVHKPVNQAKSKRPAQGGEGQGSPESLVAPEAAAGEERPVDDDQGIFVENAGLVLVHPFLNSLFETLGWVERGVFSKPEYAGVAALLTQYMARGDEPITETMLPFNKVLCGLAPEQFVDVTNMPDVATKQEARNMLEALIEHWEALKNTSIEGLRETFLCRPGKLARSDDGWALQVEAKSLDILLNQLPWGISVVKLPWCNERLHVSWI